MSHRYEIDVFWSEEDKAFLAEVPHLDGLMVHGDTHEEALAEAQVAIGFWLELAREDGRPIPEPRLRGMRSS